MHFYRQQLNFYLDKDMQPPLPFMLVDQLVLMMVLLDKLPWLNPVHQQGVGGAYAFAYGYGYGY